MKIVRRDLRERIKAARSRAETARWRERKRDTDKQRRPNHEEEMLRLRHGNPELYRNIYGGPRPGGSEDGQP